MDYILAGFSVRGIFQARVLVRVAAPSSRGSSRSKDGTHISSIASRFFTTEPPEKPPFSTYMHTAYVYVQIGIWYFFFIDMFMKKVRVINSGNQVT